MARNIEIKARSADWAEQSRVAANIAAGPPVLIVQTDTFFHSRQGRLKLREFGDGPGELIQYQRADSSGPKLSSYIRFPAPDPQSLKEALSVALGVQAVVQKKRTLYMVDQTRIHLDEVSNLGKFIELEIVLRSDQTEDDGKTVAEGLMAQLGIQKTDLVTGAYVDLLAQQGTAPAAMECQRNSGQVSSGVTDVMPRRALHNAISLPCDNESPFSTG